MRYITLLLALSPLLYSTDEISDVALPPDVKIVIDKHEKCAAESYNKALEALIKELNAKMIEKTKSGDLELALEIKSVIKKYENGKLSKDMRDTGGVELIRANNASGNQTKDGQPFIPPVFLGTIKPLSATVGWGGYCVNKNADNTPVVVRGGTPCDHFLFAHSESTLKFDIPDKCIGFTATGMSMANKKESFSIEIDGKTAVEPCDLSKSDGYISIKTRVPIGARTISLVIKNNPGGGYAAHTIWAFPYFHFCEESYSSADKADTSANTQTTMIPMDALLTGAWKAENTTGWTDVFTCESKTIALMGDKTPTPGVFRKLQAGSR